MLKIHHRKLGKVDIVCLRGRIVIGETAALRHVVERQTDASAIVLDLAGVDTIDAHGLGVFLELRAQSHSRGISFRLLNATKPVRRVLEITRLDSIFEISSKSVSPVAGLRGRQAMFFEMAACA